MFRWLHLSDIHVGMSDQDRLWPTLKHALFDDLGRLLGKTGPADLLVFSGDMAQLGAAHEFARFTEVLEEINGELTKVGPVPPLVAVPGNHDLSRPRRGGPLEAAARQAPTDSSVLRQLLDPAGEYGGLMAGVFANYSAWQRDLIDRGLHLQPVARGPMPGDMAFELGLNAGSVGIVALNSTWLQLSGEEYRTKLHVDPAQINAVTGGDPVAWCRRHAANLLVTHQPSDWLHPTSAELWRSEIFPPSRFDVHLFGHMHEHDARSTTRGGGSARREIQAASVFGLEYFGNRVARSHGYSVAEIGNRYGARAVTVWPRTLRTMAGGERKLVADQLQELTEDNNFSWPLPGPLSSAGELSFEPASRPSLDDPGRPDASVAARIEAMRYHLAAARAHAAVRRVERQYGDEALRNGGVLWIASEWGVGEDGYLRSLLDGRDQLELPIFRLDLAEYRSRDDLLADLRSVVGCTFQQLCEHLSRLPAALLLLDNVTPPIQRAPGERAVERDLEELARLVREYAPSATVVLRGRPRPTEVGAPLVSLRPFEEADVADYVRAHELGSEALAQPDVVATIWRHTTGSPVRIDTMLRDLEVTSLSDLISADESVDETPAAGVPATLLGALAELTKSGVPALERSFQLLEALTALPRGEQLERMKRFLGPHPFYLNHARELADRGLVETLQIAGLASEDAKTSAKTLVVPRMVLDYVRARMSPERRLDIEGKALDLYFGDKWRTGVIAHSLAGKRCSEALCEPYEVINACALVHRLVARSRDEAGGIEMEAAVRLASAFIEVLIDGDHFRSAAQLCEQVIQLVPTEGNDRRIDVLRFALGRSIRMVGRPEDARDIFLEIDRCNLTKQQNRQVDLGLALIYENLGDEEEAARHVREVHKGGRADGLGIQAQAILADQIGDPKVRRAELASLEQRARKRDATITANNIALTRAELDGVAVAAAHLERVVESAEAQGDFYNGARAVVRMMRSALLPPNEATSEQVNRLIRAYQHLYNERGTNLFDECHEALWRVFAATGDLPNLLRLFRHSSFIWRLRGQDGRELNYLSQLDRLASGSAGEAPSLGKELAYYRGRVSAALERRSGEPLAISEA